MKEKIISLSFSIFLFCFMLLNIFNKDKSISISERRKLEQFPKFSIDNVMDKSFMEKVDKYTLDQFVLRDTFRNIKSIVNYNLLLKLDNNGIYMKDDYIYKTEFPTNLKSIDNFIDKINNIIDKLSINNKVYYSIIPDKNYYLGNSLFLNIDYEYLYNTVKKNISNNNFIDIRGLLSINDYYKTDTHWRQENISKVVMALGNKMGFNIKKQYEKNIVNNFYGVYYGQAALEGKSEDLVYLTNDTINDSSVKYYEDNKNNKVYTLDKLNSLDKYTVFLDGASSFIEITNPNNNSGRELVIFRDSFGSSLAPLLIEAYSKITLIDIRYIGSNNYLNLINFNNQDILFLYSTLIVNNSSTLKD